MRAVEDDKGAVQTKGTLLGGIVQLQRHAFAKAVGKQIGGIALAIHDLHRIAAERDGLATRIRAGGRRDLGNAESERMPSDRGTSLAVIAPAGTSISSRPSLPTNWVALLGSSFSAPGFIVGTNPWDIAGRSVSVGPAGGALEAGG